MFYERIVNVFSNIKINRTVCELKSNSCRLKNVFRKKTNCNKDFMKTIEAKDQKKNG